MSTPHNTSDGRVVASGQRPTYPQPWRAYNAAQVNEKAMVAELLHGLCAAIDNPMQQRGRPRIPLADATFCAVMKVYAGTSGRRAMTDLREYEAKGLIDRAPHYNSVFNALENPILTPILRALVEESARPLRSVETDFAVDATGFSSAVHRRWYDAKYGKMQSMADYVKAHAMVGVRTNIVTSVEATPSNINDYPLLQPLLKRTASTFAIREVSADKGYSGRSNVEAIAALGATPLVAFKSNARAGNDGPWRTSFEFFKSSEEEFYGLYHKRSNVETTFSMIKAKFGGFVRSKTPTAQRNEVLCKVLAHNLCVLVQAFFELGITPEFWLSGRPVLATESKPSWEPNLPPRTPWTHSRKKGTTSGARSL